MWRLRGLYHRRKLEIEIRAGGQGLVLEAGYQVLGVGGRLNTDIEGGY